MSIMHSRTFYIVSILLRAMTLFSKFALIILLAKFLTVQELGLFGLISAAITYTIFVVGFEFYTYSTREMIALPKSKWLGIIRDQSVFYGLVYLLALPFILLIFYFNVIPMEYILWFLAILLFEHIAQEINRILVSEQKQLLASFILFVRQGIWCWAVILLMYFSIDTRNLNTVFVLWFAGTVTACLIGGIHISKYKNESLSKNINWIWIKKGVYLAVPMLVASIAIRGVFTFDRFFVEKIGGVEVLGAYVLFVSMASAIQSFLDTVVITFSFPKLARLNSEGDYSGFKVEMIWLSIKVICATLFLSICCWILSSIVLHWLSHDAYLMHTDLLILLIAATVIYCLSLIPHLGLYALRFDKHIVISQVLSFFIFICVSVMGIINRNVIYIPVALILSFSFLLVWKTLFYCIKTKKIFLNVESIV